MTSQSHRSHGAARSEQLGGAKDLPQGLAMGYNREQRPDAALDVLAAGTAQARRSTRLHSNRLHQTCRPVNQFEHVCVEKCPLTTMHTGKRSGDSCGESHRASAGVHPGGRSRKPDHGKTQRRKLRERVSPERSHDRIHTPVNPLGNSRPQRERTREDSDMK